MLHMNKKSKVVILIKFPCYKIVKLECFIYAQVIYVKSKWVSSLSMTITTVIFHQISIGDRYQLVNKKLLRLGLCKMICIPYQVHQLPHLPNNNNNNNLDKDSPFFSWRTLAKTTRETDRIWMFNVLTCKHRCQQPHTWPSLIC